MDADLVEVAPPRQPIFASPFLPAAATHRSSYRLPTGREVLESHKRLYKTNIKQVFLMVAIAAIVGVNDYYPSFQPDLPVYTKVVTLIVNCILAVGDFLGPLTVMSHIFSRNMLKEKANLLKKRAKYSVLLVLLDALTGFACLIGALLASSSVFANSIAGGSPSVLATVVWFLHSLHLTYGLYLFVLKLEKNLAKYLAKLCSSAAWASHVKAKSQLRKNLRELIERFEYKSSAQLLERVRCPLTPVPVIFYANSVPEVIDYAKDLLQQDQMQAGRANKERLIIKIIKYFFYTYVVWVSILYASTQMGSIHRALSNDIIPSQLREFYGNLNDKNQENMIFSSMLCLFIQYINNGINAVDNLMLHLVRTWDEIVHFQDKGRVFRHLVILLLAGFLGGLSFAFMYFSAGNGMSGVDFKSQYETETLALTSKIVKKIGGLVVFGVNEGIPQLTSVFTVVSHIASLINLFTRFKNYILGGGRPYPLCLATYRVPQVSGYEFLFKLEFVAFLNKIYKAVDSRYFVDQEPEPIDFGTGLDETTPYETESPAMRQRLLPIQHDFPQSMWDNAVLFKHYYNMTMLAQRDDRSEDSFVMNAEAQYPARLGQGNLDFSSDSDDTTSTTDNELDYFD